MQQLVFEKSPMTLAEYKTINWAYLRKTRKFLFLWPIGMLFVIAVNLITSPRNNRGNDYDLFNVGATGVFLLFFIGFIYWRLMNTFKKNYFNTPALRDGMTIVLSQDTIKATSPLINSEHPWPLSFKQAVKTGKWVLLSSGPATAYFLDTEKLALPATVTDVEALFHSKQIKFIK